VHPGREKMNTGKRNKEIQIKGKVFPSTGLGGP
jgi:hypothetical protein